MIFLLLTCTHRAQLCSPKCAKVNSLTHTQNPPKHSILKSTAFLSRFYFYMNKEYSNVLQLKQIYDLCSPTYCDGLGCLRTTACVCMSKVWYISGGLDKYCRHLSNYEECLVKSWHDTFYRKVISKQFSYFCWICMSFLKHLWVAILLQYTPTSHSLLRADKFHDWLPLMIWNKYLSLLPMVFFL